MGNTGERRVSFKLINAIKSVCKEVKGGVAINGNELETFN